MKKERKVYVVGGDENYASWMQSKVVSRMEDADLVCFTGGEDVTPGIYGKKPHPTTGSNWKRDAREIEEFNKARDLGKHLIGICRGSQFLCVMAGGVLVQNQSHPYNHPIRTIDGRTITVTSTHHQRQYPFDMQAPYQMLAYADHLSPYSEGESKKDDMSGQPEVEVCVYYDIKALAIQSHPEFVFPPTEKWHAEYIQYCRDLLDLHMEDKF